MGTEIQVLELPPIPTLVASLLSSPVMLLVDDGLVSSENSRYVCQNNFLTLLSLSHRELSSLLSLLPMCCINRDKGFIVCKPFKAFGLFLIKISRAHTVYNLPAEM